MKTHLLHKRLRAVVMLLAVLLSPLFYIENTKGFALLGPYTDWMTSTNGYQQALDIGGPMNIGEGYRWNVPVVTYAFDQSFIDYFGSNGVADVEGAIAILNNLPPASQINLDDYALDTTRINFSDASQSLIDLKSTTLYLLLQQLGLAQPSRFIYAVHDFSVTNGMMTAITLQRNFDPVSQRPTNVINGVTFQYALQASYLVGGSTVQIWVGGTTIPLDPVEDVYTAVADQGGYFSSGLGPGYFYTGLTRDDVGGLHYLLETNNFKVESLLPSVHGTGTNAGSYVNITLRAGVDKVTFVRQDYDSLLGTAYVPLTNQFIDTYITNDMVMHQQLERVVTTPDIIFSVVPYLENSWGFSCTGTSNWLNNSALNGSADLEGPGTITPPINIAFQHQIDTFALTGEDPQISLPYLDNTRWGSFDDSTNPPVNYPVHAFEKNINSLQVYLELLGNPVYLTVPAITNLPYPSSTNFLSWQWLGSQNLSWNLPLSFGQTATLQSSTNLVDWVPEATITNYGLPLWWINSSSNSQEFFRVIPQTNSP